MANEQCSAATTIRPTQATLNGQADSIPANESIRFAYGTVAGGPYTEFTPLVPGDNSVGQTISEVISGLENETTYYYLVEHVASDGNAVLGNSSECSFVTGSFNPECEMVSLDGQAGSAVLRARADFVPPESNLQIVWGTTMGGPYPNTLCSVPGTNVVDQTLDCTFNNVPPCETIYFAARVADIPVAYIVDWQYAHSARTTGPESAELRLGDDSDYPANQTVVDAHTSNGTAEGWTVRTGTYSIPSGTDLLHMGFVSTSGVGTSTGGVGNFLDNTSIILRTAGGVNLGEQLLNRGFEIPVSNNPNGVTYPPEHPTTPGIAWQTNDPVGVLELWTSSTAIAGAQTASEGNQYVELNAFNRAELFQVVELDKKTDDSSECMFVVTEVTCLPASPVGQTEATLRGEACGVYFGTATRFVYGSQPGYPYTHATPLLFHDGTTDQLLISDVVSLSCDTQYFYRVEAYDVREPNANLNVPISVSSECSLMTDPCVVWCGGTFDQDDCTVVDIDGDGEGDYFNCWPGGVRDGFPGEGVGHASG